MHDGILALHEITHEVHSPGYKGVFVKLHFHKAYDRLDWSFLKFVLLFRGFGGRWCSWIMLMVQSSKTTTNINGEVEPYFSSSVGVKQGDPISPLLFNPDVDALAGIHLTGVVGHLIPGGGFTHLQHADDTMIIVEGSNLDIVNHKFLLVCFEAMSGLKIILDKSEVFVLGYSLEDQLRIVDNLNCKLSAFPTTYWGMPFTKSKISTTRFDPLVGRVASRAEPWRGMFTSKGSKTVLISTNLASLRMFMMGLYIVSESVHSSFSKELARFLWHASKSREKYHMVKRAHIYFHAHGPWRVGDHGLVS